MFCFFCSNFCVFLRANVQVFFFGFMYLRKTQNDVTMNHQLLGPSSTENDHPDCSFHFITIISAIQIQSTIIVSKSSPKDIGNFLKETWLWITSSYLVGGFNPFGNLPQIGVKIKNISNHHPAGYESPVLIQNKKKNISTPFRCNSG